MHASTDSIVIPSWANGPDDSGNGGWTAGLLAQHVTGAASGIGVDLRVPPPLGRPLHVHDDGSGTVSLQDPDQADQLVATAYPEPVDLVVPEQVLTLRASDAQAASAGFPFRDEHPFPHCVCCGIQRAAGVPSLDLHCGALSGTDLFADAWRPGRDLADADDSDVVGIAATWSALDCPSAAPFAAQPQLGPAVLAHIAVRIDERPRIDETYVVAAWQVRIDGRKLYSCSALAAPGSHVLAVASALWIELRR